MKRGWLVIVSLATGQALRDSKRLPVPNIESRALEMLVRISVCPPSLEVERLKGHAILRSRRILKCSLVQRL